MAELDSLPSALAETLRRFPSPGERNLWLFEVAARARLVASPARIEAFLESVVAHQGWADRDFTPEIRRAVRRAYSSSGPVEHPPSGRSSVAKALRKESYPPWPTIEEPVLQSVQSTQLLFDPSKSLDLGSADILDALYRPDALLCFAKNNTSAVTAPRTRWQGREADFQFIVANPMTALMGRTQEGKPSSRCHGNATTDRVYQVVEFDQGTPEEQAAILSGLHSESAPLVLVVWSGSKSLHGWFDVRGLSDPEKREFFAQACRCGADRTLWDQSKLVRMPGGTRSSNGERQSILYFTPPETHSELTFENDS